MSLRNSEQAFGWLAKLFHWLMFLLVCLAMFVGNRLDDLEGAAHTALEDMHRSWGVVILALLVLRLAWRVTNPQPAAPAGSPAWMNLGARAVHWLFYGLILLQTTAGIAMSQAEGDRVSLFGLLQLPQLVAPGEATEHFWHEVHEVTWIVILVLALVHAAAALHHHFGARDNVLRRMWF